MYYCKLRSRLSSRPKQHTHRPETARRRPTTSPSHAIIASITTTTDTGGQVGIEDKPGGQAGRTQRDGREQAAEVMFN